MKIKIDVGIYGVPTKLNLSAKILYGKKEQYERTVFRKEFTLDDGGSVVLPYNFFTKYIEANRVELGNVDESEVS